MAIISGGRDGGAKKICDALGISIERVHKITLVVECRSITTVTIERHVTTEEIDRLAEVLPEIKPVIVEK